MAAEKLEHRVLRFVASQALCAREDLELFIREETGGTAEEAVVTATLLLAEWEDRGWADTAEMDPAGQITLTDRAFEELPWLPRQD